MTSRIEAPTLLALVLSALLSFEACGQDRLPVLVGTVTKIVDGDTIDVQLSSGPIRVRLHGIDTPERGQPGGKEATGALIGFVQSREVDIEPFSQDRYDRMIAIVYRGDLNVNLELVRQGHAWAYRRYMRKEDSELCIAEAAAPTAKRGASGVSGGAGGALGVAAEEVVAVLSRLFA